MPYLYRLIQCIKQAFDGQGTFVEFGCILYGTILNVKCDQHRSSVARHERVHHFVDWIEGGATNLRVSLAETVRIYKSQIIS
jgi:hypothetical protein